MTDPETPAQEIGRLIAEGVWQPVEQDDTALRDLVERFNASALEFFRQVDEDDNDERENPEGYTGINVW